MRTLVLTLAAVAATGLFSAENAEAHGLHRHYAHVNVGIGYTYGYRYPRPYRYYYPPAYIYPRSYVAIDPWPTRTVRRVRSTESGDVTLKQLYVYPAAGQSEQQLADDRYACHVWSADRAGFDPTLGAGAAAQADAYARAMTACLEARNYVVR